MYMSRQAFAAQYHNASPSASHCMQAVVAGQQRRLPSVKSTNWVRDRQPLEKQHKRPGVAEVLLHTPEGRLLEGLVSNLCVICVPCALSVGMMLTLTLLLGHEVHHCHTKGRCNMNRLCLSAVTAFSLALSLATDLRYIAGQTEENGIELQTAPSEYVLDGTMRQRVLQACQVLGIAVEQTCPDPRLRRTWREAFICNSRGLQPLRSIQCLVHDSGTQHQPALKLCVQLASALRTATFVCMLATFAQCRLQVVLRGCSNLLISVA